jgi:hypothetical protein
MARTETVQLLRRLHEAQQAFYAGGDEAPVRTLSPTMSIGTSPAPGRSRVITRDRHRVGVFPAAPDLVDRTFRMHPGDVLVGDGDRIAASPMGRPWSLASGGAGRPLVCNRSVTGGVADCWLPPLDPAAFDDIWTGPDRRSVGSRREAAALRCRAQSI